MIAGTVSCEIRDHVATVELRNPTVCNALTRPVREQLLAALERIDGRDDVHVVVLQGAGGNFTSGLYLQDMYAVPDATFAQFAEILAIIPALRQPVIAAIDGYCLGGGAQLAFTCDLRIAGASARIGIPAGKARVHYPEVLFGVLVDSIGRAAANYLLLTGEALDADAALSMGLVQRRCPEGTAPGALAQDLARRIAAQDPDYTAVHKARLTATGSVHPVRPVDQQKGPIQP